MQTRWSALVLVGLLGCGEDPPAEAPPEPAVVEVAEDTPPPPPPEDIEVEVEVRSGDTIAALLQAQGLSYAEALQVVAVAAPHHDLVKIKVGDRISIVQDADGGWRGLRYPLDRHGERWLVVQRSGTGFEAIVDAVPLEVRPLALLGVVESSLWESATSLGLEGSQIVAMASIFEWEFDFNTQVRQGDRFRLVVEELRDAATGVRKRWGRVLAAEYVSGERTMRGYRFEDGEGRVAYFDDEGMSSKKMFLKSPLKFSRISSGFSKKRYHPVLKKWRSHNGIDYAAGTGTPVRAIGRGKVSFAGTKGGYGKHVRVQHDKKYGSSYSHLSRIAVKDGARVDQGDIVGYVGATGLATGPHLHFEFYVDGRYVDFQRQSFPRSEPIEAKERPAFEALRASLQPLLAGATPQVAVMPAPEATPGPAPAGPGDSWGPLPGSEGAPSGGVATTP